MLTSPPRSEHVPKLLPATARRTPPSVDTLSVADSLRSALSKSGSEAVASPEGSGEAVRARRFWLELIPCALTKEICEISGARNLTLYTLLSCSPERTVRSASP